MFPCLSKSQEGQAVVEFALSAVLFFVLLFGIVEFSHLFHVKLTLRHALREAGRYMVTGRADVPDPNNPGNNLVRAQAVEAIFHRHLTGTGAGLQGFTMNPSNGGGPGDTVTLTATFNKPLFTGFFSSFIGGNGGCPTGNVCFTMQVSWVNEPFQ
jgi:Flp pilus assembly protein TadG